MFVGNWVGIHGVALECNENAVFVRAHSALKPVVPLRSTN